MGGNVAIMNNGKVVQADKINLRTLGRQEFMKQFVAVFQEMNKKFNEEHEFPIWEDESHLFTGFAFNGSSSYIMNPEFKDSEILKYKPEAGDIDIVVPDGIKSELWQFLSNMEGTEIVPGVKYLGSNKPTISSIGEQINTLFQVSAGQVTNVQVDFEFLEFEGNKPTEWAKFAHSSSFEDTKHGIKAVHHKYLIQALVGGASVRDDIVIVTPASKPEKLTFKKMNGELPRMLKFSVGRGIRTAYEPMLDNGEQMYHDGKPIYRELHSKTAEYETRISEIYKMTFPNADMTDLLKFQSFMGILYLIKKYMTKEQIERTHQRYLEKLWSITPRAQELEVQNWTLDYSIKKSGYQSFINVLVLKDRSKEYTEEYYKDYGFRKTKIQDTFRSYLKELETK